MDTTVFYIVLFLHCLSLIVGFGSALVVDFFGLLWILKKPKATPIWEVADIAQVLIRIGWAGMIVSGIPLLIMKSYLDNLIKLKIFLVLLVGVNSFFLHAVKKAAKNISNAEKAPPGIVFRLGFGTVISQLGWWGAIIIGFYQRNIEHRVQWPANPWVYMIAMSLFFAAAFFTGKLLFKSRK